MGSVAAVKAGIGYWRPPQETTRMKVLEFWTWTATDGGVLTAGSYSTRGVLATGVKGPLICTNYSGV
jgi:hypothetical protein